MAFRSLKENELIENSIVVDNSVMMRWLFKDGSAPDQQYAQKIFHHIQSNKPSVIVPYLWVYESSFVVNYYTKKESLDRDESLNKLKNLFDLCLVIRGSEKPEDLFDLSNRTGLSTYDSAYVMLATQQKCHLASLDKGIVKASKKLDYEIFPK